MANEMLWDAVSSMTLDQAEKVFTEDFENHAYVGAVGTFMGKVV
jgi:hypothetical protein